MTMSPLLMQAIKAAKEGRKQEAESLLQRVLEQGPRNEQAWLWMSDVVESNEDKIHCLRRVLAINPHNDMAQKGLVYLEEKIAEETTKEAEPEPEVELSTESARDIPSTLKPCPFCAEMIQAAAILCRFCGQDLHSPRNVIKPTQAQPQLLGNDASPQLQPASPERAGMPSLVGAEQALEREIRKCVEKGFSVISRTSTSAQLRRPKKFDSGCAIFSFLFLGVGVIVYLLYYAGQKDTIVYLDVNDQGVVELTMPKKPTNYAWIIVLAIMIIIIATCFITSNR